MNLELMRNALMWCTAINFALLIVWFLFFVLVHDWLHRSHSKWFKLPEHSFNAIHYAGMMIFKLFIFMFNLVPFMALHIVA